MRRVVIVLLMLLVFTAQVEASPKIVSYDDISVDKITSSNNFVSELLQVDSEIESLIKEKTQSKRLVYELENKLREEEVKLERSKEEIESKLELIESDSLTMQIFRATGDSENYISEKELEVKRINKNINNLKESIKKEKELVSSNQEEVSFLFSQREEYLVYDTNSFEDIDISSVIEELESTTKIASANSELLWPLKEYGLEWISSHYGVRSIHPITKEKDVMHHGLDIAIPFYRWPGTREFNGAPVYILAATNGVAYSYESSGGYGNYVIVVNDQFTTRYAHTHENLVENGEVVTAGQPIAIVGSTGVSTGPHLHFEVWVNGVTVDPLKYLKEVTYE